MKLRSALLGGGLIALVGLYVMEKQKEAAYRPALTTDPGAVTETDEESEATERLVESSPSEPEGSPPPLRKAVWNEQGYTSLSEAFREGKPERIDELLRVPIDVNLKDKDGGTALHHASRYGELELVIRLIERGADVNARNDYGQSPMHFAVEAGALDILQELISSGGALENNWRQNKKTGKEQSLSVFLTAVIHDYGEIVEFLAKESPAQLKKRDLEGRDAVVIALAAGNNEMAARLRELGVETEL